MEFSWFTFVAQIINFLILAAVLKFLLYDRITGIMDKREKRIRSDMEKAEDREAEAEKEKKDYRRRKEELEEKRREMISKAEDEADEKKKKLVEAAREEAKEEERKWKESVRKEKTEFLREMEKEAGERLCDSLRRAFSDLADADLEERMIDVFLDRLKETDTEQSEKKATLLSSFRVQGKLKKRTASELMEITGAKSVEYERKKELVCGIELRRGGEKIAWNAVDYIDSLEQRMENLIESRKAEGNDK